MIVGFDASRAFIDERTGTENYSYQLLLNLAKIDRRNTYNIYVKPTKTSTIVEKNVGWPSNFQIKVIPWSRLWTQGGLAIQTFKDKLDVLFVPAHTLPLIRKPGLKTVVTIHDLGSEYLPSMHQIKQRVYLSFMQKIQLKTATCIIAVSKATKEDLVERIGIAPNKITVVYEGYDQKLFKPIKGDILVNSLKYYELECQSYFLFVGTVQPRKNLERVIKAFATWLGVLSSRSSVVHPFGLSTQGQRPHSLLLAAPVRRDPLLAATPRRHDLVIVGQKGWMSNEIYKLPKKLGIEDRVKFLGYVSEDDLPQLYSGAIALLFPSLFEGFGLPILEAQACGCPVLTSNTSSMPEVAGKGAVYVNPNSVDDIVEGMKKVQVVFQTAFGRTNTKYKIVKKGFENIKRFSWEKCAKETLEVLESV